MAKRPPQPAWQRHLNLEIGNTPPAKKKPPTRPTINIPPPAPKAGSTGAAFNSFINAHPTMRPYADTIWKFARAYGVDPVVAAGLYWRESFAAAGKGQDPATITSPAGAVGIGQIMPLHVGGKAPWGTLTQSDLTNPARNIQWSMWFFAQKVDQFGDYNAAYNQGYNPGYKGADLTSLLPKGYVPRSGLAPQQKGQVAAETAAATAAAKAQIYDRWVVRNPNGTLGFAKIKDATRPPKNVVVAGGQPLTLSAFQQAKTTYDNYYYTYLGRPATNREVAALLEHPTSEYQLTLSLSKKPGFEHSPIWKSHANGIVGVAQSLYGNNWKPTSKADKELIRRAIVENWDQATLEENLRNRPAYLQGPVFKDGVAKFSNAFQSIYGAPGADAQQLVREAVASGWTGDEWAMWLRAQPAYTTSPEYQANALNIATQLGLVTGRVPALKPGAPPENVQPKPGTGIPESARIPGTAGPLAPRMIGGKTYTTGEVNA